MHVEVLADVTPSDYFHGSYDFYHLYLRGALGNNILDSCSPMALHWACRDRAFGVVRLFRDKRQNLPA
jgi:hypothetical protein